MTRGGPPLAPAVPGDWRLVRQGGALEVSIPWARRSDVVGGVVMLGWVVAVGLLAGREIPWRNLAGASPLLKGFAMVLLLLPVLLYRGLGQIFNRTQVSVGRAVLVTRVTPFPWGGGLELPLSEARQLQVDEVRIRRGTTAFQVFVSAPDGRRVVAHHLRTRAEAEALVALLEGQQERVVARRTG